jgi:hypothetical protein
VYSHCIHGQDDLLNQQIDHVLEPFSRSGPCPSVRKPAVTPDRATGADAVRDASVTSPPGPPTARRPRRHPTGTAIRATGICTAQKQY